MPVYDQKLFVECFSVALLQLALQSLRTEKELQQSLELESAKAHVS